MSAKLKSALISGISVIKIRVHTGIQLVGNVAGMRARSRTGLWVSIAASCHGVMASSVVHVRVNARIQFIGNVGAVRASGGSRSSVEAASSACVAIMGLVAHSGIYARVKRIGDIGSMGSGIPVMGSHRSSAVATQIADSGSTVI